MHKSLALSFEFFPPGACQGRERLSSLCEEFSRFNPQYFSVTYGASGSDQQNTLLTVEQLTAAGYGIVPHLSCMNLTEDKAITLLNTYRVLGVDQLLIVRGDLPIGEDCHSDFPYASDLIKFVKNYYGNAFEVTVAAYPEFHPEAGNAFDDICYFRNKIINGASRAITQYFFDANAYYHFIDICSKYKIDIPIIPGIMPINDYDKLLKISKLCQTEIPLWIHRRMQSYQDSESQRLFSIEIVTKLCEDLIKFGAPGLHLYTLNQIDPVQEILNNLGLGERLKSSA
ncbi:methylenetetrahydrofolate reductase [Piscirickettsia litoralis]|uniref:Methylenetetrahydrofolate reductase n=1 Tax=Piscirickettsia litoralis TaxID=1891921 RepID=A0ABX2ZYY0_9GAMM|nr:methylenetetrahydrofolate reductase [Piscirickettsia litoralis]ODN41824.1 hypothetical protein BGC07_01075 [Piscirickettsia litoralis]